jgi:biotin synthase
MSSMVSELLSNPEGFDSLGKEEIGRLLVSEGSDRDLLFSCADRTRELHVGNDVHLRGIIEFSNYCIKNCFYCGLRRDNSALERYRMTEDEIVEAAGIGIQAGLKTLVLQSGEDPFFTGDVLARLIGRLKSSHDVAITMSVGDRSRDEYKLMRDAGADRYLLKHETADPELFSRLRPGTTLEGRIRRLTWLRELGFQVGSGGMIGLPWQTVATLAEDILLLKRLDVEMAGFGPFIPHGHTPLASCAGGSVDMTLKTLAVARLVLPFTHFPATTALGSIDPEGRQRALRCGANVVMPNITPVRYKKLYEIYPNKICITEEGSEQCLPCIAGIIRQSGRSVATDYGHGRKPASLKAPL